MKFCKNCRYYWRYQKLCDHPEAMHSRSLVTGRRKLYRAEYMRANLCGKEAILFESKLPFLKRIFKFFKENF